MMEMTRRLMTYLLVSSMLLLWGGCLTAQAQMDAQQSSWGSTSFYRSSYQSAASASQMPVASKSYTPAYRSISAFDSKLSEGANLSSYFQYTPADALLSDYSSDGGVYMSARRRGNWWDDEPDDNPIGVTPNPQPIGDPLCLIGAALIYGLCLMLRRRRIFQSRFA